MSRIKELKEMPQHCLNIIDVLSLLCPEGKVKYVETLLRIMKSGKGLNDAADKAREDLQVNYNINKETLNGFDSIQVLHIRKFITDMFSSENLIAYQKFCEFNERKLVNPSDLSLYNNFTQIKTIVDDIEEVLKIKESEKQIVKILETDEWLILKPITHEASKKYGAGTTWCTTSENDDSTFNDYGEGILIYCIPKKDPTGKVACHKSLEYDELTFWDAQDKQIDSLESKIPYDILLKIKHEVDTCTTGNISLTVTS
jgi:hypothetical protein